MGGERAGVVGRGQPYAVHDRSGSGIVDIAAASRGKTPNSSRASFRAGLGLGYGVPADSGAHYGSSGPSQPQQKQQQGAGPSAVQEQNANDSFTHVTTVIESFIVRDRNYA